KASSGYPGTIMNLAFLGPQLPFSFTDAHSLCLNLTVKSQARPEHPWYEVQGSVDKKPFLQYDSDSSKVRPLGLLGKKVNATKAWTELTQMLADVGQELRMILPDIKLENNMTKGPPTLHKLLSCQCEAECRQMTLFFDAMKISWTVVNPGARGIKEEWESKGMADYFRRISMGDCNQWLQEFLEHWEKMLEQPWWLSGLAPPSAQGLILETWNRVPCWAPCVEPASPSACVSASLSLSLCLS
uniref:MHC class I-like antigen recognition-like domain-containing protein n=1 Tax=Canis lupus dingo TaxID=286419 RepID=A0A8C0KM10_CANLU